LGRLGRQEEAEEQLRRVLDLDPEDEQAYLALAQAVAGRGQFRESRQLLERALGEIPDSRLVMSALIQLLLASPDPEVRDAAAAVPLATRLHEAEPSIQNGAMVAAALGAAGRFAEAVEWQARVLREAEAADWPEERLQRMRSDLALYRQRAGGG
jgi:tetratricopeptide (TPR) repeat protein